MPAAQLEIGAGNEGQVEAWDGDEGDLWSQHPDFFDDAIREHHSRLMDAAAVGSRDVVLDVGCGNGQTTCDAAQAARSGSALGVDLSSKMIENARALAVQRGLTNASFLRADAQAHNFDAEVFDAAISRTGTMFFADQIAAFTNIAKSLRPGGRIVMLSWSGPEGNEWLASFVQAMTLGRPAPLPPVGVPGPFAHADRERTTGLLTTAGFGEVSFELSDAPMYFGRTADEGFDVLRRQLGWLANGLADAERPQAFENLLESLRAHETPRGVAYSSSAWLITARRV
jgi:SAM-dependent methyltransferase